MLRICGCSVFALSRSGRKTVNLENLTNCQDAIAVHEIKLWLGISVEPKGVLPPSPTELQQVEGTLGILKNSNLYPYVKNLVLY